MANPRKTVSKRTRFDVFVRDNFTCRYCGRQSDAVPLVIDHMVPVVHGGTNDIENLVTACEPCNQGKAAKVLGVHAPNETDRLRLLQEGHEQMRAALAARQIAEARTEMERVMVEYWCEARGTEEYHPHTLKLMTNWAMRYTAGIVFQWIDIAARAMPYQDDYKLAKYISGIRKNWIAEGRVPGDI